MKEIKLTQGKVALVDDDMFDFLNKWKWHYRKGKNNKYGYALRTEGVEPNRKKIYMHSVIMQSPPGTETDHIDLDGCNNQRYNLRNCTHSQNEMNGNMLANNKSGYKGVCWHKHVNAWQAQIGINGKTIYLGCFDKAIDAARAYDSKAIELFGEFARINGV